MIINAVQKPGILYWKPAPFSSYTTIVNLVTLKQGLCLLIYSQAMF